ncbi:MAG: HAMP domain-containing histidine kinase [Clostridiales bacterium]|nr:HAMP domain-containing histidine kinase [Clostridiales bacterium]
MLAQAAAQPKQKKRGKPGGAWERFTKGCQKLWKQLISSLVVRIVCNGAVSAFAAFIAATIIRAALNLGAAMTFLFFIAFTLLIFIKLTNHTMSYIKDIAEAVGKISGGDYSVKVPEKYSDELGTLAGQINQMTVELSRAREREQLEEQRKNEFITSIAHDLRTPLTSVIGYLGLISEQDGQPVDKETLVRYADVAFRKSKRLEQLISQLFDFSRYNFGEIHPAENRIDLAELLEQIHQEFYPQFTERQLQSRVIISGRPVMVKGDGNMLVRVFDNILGNAVRYGANGRYIDIELYNRGAEAVVRVTNYGAEISPEDLSRIFDKFYRTDASRSSETGGAGLGMAIAKNIVEAHGGRIRALSGDGKVTFEVVLPVIAP